MSSFDDVRPICWQCGGDLKFNDDWDKPWCPVDGWCDVRDIAVPRDILEALLDCAKTLKFICAPPTDASNMGCSAVDRLAEFGELPGGE